MDGPGGWRRPSRSVMTKMMKESVKTGHPTGLPDKLVRLFAPGPPVRFVAENAQPKKKPKLPYTGIGALVSEFAGPGDAEYQPPSAAAEQLPQARMFRNKELELQVRLDDETKLEKKKRLHDWKVEKNKKELEEKAATFNPADDPMIEGDSYKTLFVPRLSYEVTERKLRHEFEEFGPIKRIRLVHDRNTDKPRGYAFIEYEHKKDMKEAYKQADGRKIEGRRILVDVERGRTVENWRPMRLGGGLGGDSRAAKEPRKKLLADAAARGVRSRVGCRETTSADLLQTTVAAGTCAGRHLIGLRTGAHHAALMPVGTGTGDGTGTLGVSGRGRIGKSGPVRHHLAGTTSAGGMKRSVRGAGIGITEQILGWQQQQQQQWHVVGSSSRSWKACLLVLSCSGASSAGTAVSTTGMLCLVCGAVGNMCGAVVSAGRPQSCSWLVAAGSSCASSRCRGSFACTSPFGHWLTPAGGIAGHAAGAAVCRGRLRRCVQDHSACSFFVPLCFWRVSAASTMSRFHAVAVVGEVALSRQQLKTAILLLPALWLQVNANACVVSRSQLVADRAGCA